MDNFGVKLSRNGHGAGGGNRTRVTSLEGWSFDVSISCLANVLQRKHLRFSCPFLVRIAQESVENRPGGLAYFGSRPETIPILFKLAQILT